MLQFHEDTIDAAKNWGSIDDFCNFKYSVSCPSADDLKKNSEKDELNSTSDTSSVLSETCIQVKFGYHY